MANCVWNFACQQTGATSTITFEPGTDFGSGTWTLLISDCVYQYVQTGAEGNFCGVINLNRISGSDGPTILTINGLHTPQQATGAKVSCCGELPNLVPQPAGVLGVWTMAMSAQSGCATCCNVDGPFDGTASSPFNPALWSVGHGGPYTSPDTCEGGGQFGIWLVGGCLVGGIGDGPGVPGFTPSTLLSASEPTDNPFVLVYQVDLTYIVCPGGASAIFTVSVPNNPPYNVH